MPTNCADVQKHVTVEETRFLCKDRVFQFFERISCICSICSLPSGMMEGLDGIELSIEEPREGKAPKQQIRWNEDKNIELAHALARFHVFDRKHGGKQDEKLLAVQDHLRSMQMFSQDAGIHVIHPTAFRAHYMNLVKRYLAEAKWTEEDLRTADLEAVEFKTRDARAILAVAKDRLLRGEETKRDSSTPVKRRRLSHPLPPLATASGPSDDTDSTGPSSPAAALPAHHSPAPLAADVEGDTRRELLECLKLQRELVVELREEKKELKRRLDAALQEIAQLRG